MTLLEEILEIADDNDYYYDEAVGDELPCFSKSLFEFHLKSIFERRKSLLDEYVKAVEKLLEQKNIGLQEKDFEVLNNLNDRANAVNKA